MDHQQGRKQIASPEVAMASEVFDLFCNASTLKSILGHFRHLCELLKIKPNSFNQFYPKLKSKLRSWKAQALWKKFDQRANHKCYNRGKACPNTRVLIIGGGPCGLRSAIEAQLLGAKVVVVEKRDRMSRNNVLHLWPFVIQDLRALGAKKFFGKFCAGAIDHISIRQLQCILLKVALILGVEFHEGVSFESLVPPPENQEEGKIGWRAKITPADHPVSQYEFDVLIGADGKRNTLEGFKRKEFRGKLAIAITANFINKRTEAEARVEEISGVAFIFNQKFFKELYQDTGIDLENIVYYKDDTHYFVMTAKKHSLIDKGVILQDHADTAKLLAKENVDREALMLYAREAAEFSTEYQMMDMEFAVNHYGQPDVAMFDFTSMYAAENASRVLERHGHRLLMILVGDSLLEPFWPTGSGCARGFLSSLDACWAIKGWGASTTPLEVLAERESIYRLLGQTTPENLNRDYAAYTLNPHTRYPNLNLRSVTPIQVRGLLDTDDPDNIEQPSVQPAVDIPKKRRRRDLGTDSQVHPDTLLHWLRRQVALYDTVRIDDMGSSFKDGLAICAIIHRYRPDLIDFQSLKSEDVEINNQLAFDILEKELGIPPVMTGEEMAQCDVPDKLAMFSYLTQIYETFRGEIPHIKHPKLEPEKEERPTYSKQLSQLTPEQKAQLIGRIAKQDNTNTRARHSRSSRHSNEHAQNPLEKKGDSISRRSRKRRSTEKMGATVDREPKLHAGQHRGSVDEGFSGRIKNIEDKLRGTAPSDKKPKDLLRAIGKIEKTDWNVKEIEKKIEENKMGRGIRQDKVERVPKWSREQVSICFIQFLARQTKMEKKGRNPNEPDSKYADIDSTLKNIDKKIKEGNVLGHNKVSAMAEQFANKNQDAEPKVQRSNSKAALVLPAQGGSEMCHFCNKRVYLMERLSAEGKFFHRGCFRCEYCSTSLRIGNHTFDRDKHGGRFYCMQHFGLSGTMKARVEKKKIPVLNKENIPNTSINMKTPEKSKTPLEGVAGLDLLDRGQTPERIEFENLAGVSDAEEPRSQMDEDEWTDRNFGASAAEMGSSDDISDMSDSDDDNEVFEEAIDQPLTTEGTLELAKNWTLRYSHPHATTGHSDTGSNEYEDSSDEYTSEVEFFLCPDEESGTATEDEEEVRARELRKQEVWLKVPPRSSDTDTGSETEVASDEDSTEDSAENSATEISTDSEFEHDGTTPTQHEIPEIAINDSYVRKGRGNYVEPKKVQVKSHVIPSINGNLKQNKDTGVKLKFTKLDPGKEPLRPQNELHLSRPIAKTISPSPLMNPRKGDYLLNRTHSTEGIASKLSLELKKRYLLGGSALGGSVMKSGSTSNVDTKLRSLTDAISQHQKLLNPAPEPSPTMQAFLQGTSKLRSSNTQLSPISPTAIFSASPLKPFSFDQQTKTEDSVAGKTTAMPDVSKMQLPDLLKETSILKSKTDPNIVRKESPKISEKKPIREIMAPKQIDAQAIVKEDEEIIELERTTNIEPMDNIDDGADCRPRSPLHETSIIVPQVNWNKNKETKDGDSSEDSEIDSDSLSSSDVEFDEGAADEQVVPINLSPPRLQIHSTDGDLLLDEEVEDKNKDVDETAAFEPDSIECIRIDDDLISRAEYMDGLVSEKIPSEGDEVVNNNLEQGDSKKSYSNCSSPTSVVSNISNKQDDSEENDVTTAALTETEFSEWARDGEGLVSDDLRDVEFNINPEFITTRRNKLMQHMKLPNVPVRIAKEEDLTDIELESYRLDKIIDFPNNNTSKLLANGENIDFMDTDNESLLDDSLQDATNIALIKNRGYVEFVNIKTASTPTRTPMEVKADAPIAKTEVENESGSEHEQYKDDNVIEINPVTMDDVMDRLNGAMNKSVSVPPRNLNLDTSAGDTIVELEEQPPVEAINRELFQSMDEDSLLIVEQAEDTTTSEIITVLASPINPQMPVISNQVEISNNEEPSKSAVDTNNPDYLEYVKRLQSRIAEFSNAKDSIDIRKSKRKNSKSSAQLRSAEMIAEEIKNQEVGANNSFNSPATSRKLEEITRERTKQKSLIQDLLMDKLEAHKQKSAEKKARRAARASSFSPGSTLSPLKFTETGSTSPTPMKFVPTSIISPVSSPVHTTFAEARNVLDMSTPTTNLSQGGIVRSYTLANVMPLSSFKQQSQEEKNLTMYSTTPKESASTSKIPEKLADDEFKTPVAPPRLKYEEAKRTAEKAKQEARERARLKSDEDLGLSPEDKIKELRMKVARRQLSMETRKKTDEELSEMRSRHYSFESTKPGHKLQTSKSTDNVKAFAKKVNVETLPPSNAKSMDELLQTSGSKMESSTMVPKRDKKKAKDPERRKSIIQAVSDFFKKKDSSPSPPNQKDKLSRFRLTGKSKEKGKLYKSYSDGSDLDKDISPKYDSRPKSVSEGMLVASFLNENPPPIPPPPLSYAMPTTHISDDSISEDDSKATALSVSQMHKTTLADGSCNSISRKAKTAKRIARQAQLKRLRMAQEIQRKLEETEVKQRELESRGVSVEKALRGEGESCDREEADLMSEWFDLMRERTELRRYEKELLVRAQEVQLEDRHDRLQQELRERLADDDKKKTKDDVKKEGEILTEMLEIVSKRDSLIALLEEERQRWRRPSCPTLTVPTSVIARPIKTVEIFPSPSVPSPSYMLTLLAILAAYLISLHLTEFFVSSHIEPFIFFL
ncbi:F-actin-monooxygenase Mical isoform X15 [Cephus cinctus]|uniref:F-actin monooxygenase n=1 Tax=Cephus cinctus TaxID=211228 RepID=A0AAJ7RUT1_CEPCN|nr:F-actin-monooxygenase Mical isoform X15 [Cephus cinctus]